MGQAALFVGEPDEVVEARRRALREQRRGQAQSQAPRLVEPTRKQIELRSQDLDSVLPPHPPRPVAVGGGGAPRRAPFLRTDQGAGQPGGGTIVTIRGVS